ncbi:hypothetical protein BDN70DRAFT_920543 [Pholiota conissans]|uniref:Uncharacterized protein n=1 Tax=Pholiota conissans TaxID=109636 RepID=A0A9P5Z430_9AGAR|nr:hypothetical protein BDN70DRAFT_920543 [Pholiota conissans]
MSWISAVQDFLLAIRFFLVGLMVKTVALFTRVLKSAGSLTPVLPVIASITPSSRRAIVRGYTERFFVNPISNAYNAADNFVFQTYGYIIWNSPRYIAQAKLAFRRIHDIIFKFIRAERSPNTPRTSIHRLRATLGFSPTIVVRDSVWTDWGTQAPPEDANEWIFYIRGCADRQGMTITQSAWKGYQSYIQRLGLPPVDSPSRITIKDFEAYQAAVAMVGRMITDSPIPGQHSSSPPFIMGCSPMSYVYPLSSFPSGKALASSPGSMATLSMSSEPLSLDAKLGFTCNNAEVNRTTGVYRSESASPIFGHLPVVIKDVASNKSSSVNIMPRKVELNLRSINSFGEIEALFVDSFRAPVSDADRRYVCSLPPRSSKFTSSSIYSQETARSIDTSSGTNAVYDCDDCAIPVVATTSSEALCEINCLAISEDFGRNGDSTSSFVHYASGDFCAAGDLIDPPTVCYMTETCLDTRGSLSGLSAASSHLDCTVTWDIIRGSPFDSDSDIDEDDYSYIAVEADEPIRITSISDAEWALAEPEWNDVVSKIPFDADKLFVENNRHATIICGLEIDPRGSTNGVSGLRTCATHDVLERSSYMKESSHMDADVSIYRESWVTYRTPSLISDESSPSERSFVETFNLDLKAIKGKTHESENGNENSLRFINTMSVQHPPAPNSISPEAFSASAFRSAMTPDISSNRALLVPNCGVDRHNALRISYFIERDLQHRYGSPTLSHRQDVPF